MTLQFILLFNKFIGDDIDVLETMNLLYQNGILSTNTLLLFNEMYLQQCNDYSGGGIIVMFFMNDGLKENAPYMTRAAPMTI